MGQPLLSIWPRREIFVRQADHVEDVFTQHQQYQADQEKHARLLQRKTDPTWRHIVFQQSDDRHIDAIDQVRDCTEDGQPRHYTHWRLSR